MHASKVSLHLFLPSFWGPHLSKTSLTFCAHAGSVTVNHKSTWFSGILKEDFCTSFTRRQGQSREVFSYFPGATWTLFLSFTLSVEILAFQGLPYLPRLSCASWLSTGCWNPRLWVKGQPFSLKQTLSLVSTQHARSALWLYFLSLCIFLTLLLIHLIEKILKHFISHFREF